MIARTADAVRGHVQEIQPSQVAHWIECACDAPTPNPQVHPQYTQTLHPNPHTSREKPTRNPQTKSSCARNQKRKCSFEVPIGRMYERTADVVGVQIQTGQPGQVAHGIERACDAPTPNHNQPSSSVNIHPPTNAE
jgi:hypothetical protein